MFLPKSKCQSLCRSTKEAKSAPKANSAGNLILDRTSERAQRKKAFLVRFSYYLLPLIGKAAVPGFEVLKEIPISKLAEI